MAEPKSNIDMPDGAIDTDDVLDVEELAVKTGITGDEAQRLVDRIGNDRQALEAAARELKSART